jgi:flavin reductase (DIM6/NTAB) family NADH-FMN oxidoreductase RutF
MDAVKVCGEHSGRDSDKFKMAKITPVKGAKVNAPCIQEAPVNIECKVVKELDVGDHTWFLGEVKITHIKKDYDWRHGLLFKWIGEDGFFYKVGEQVGKV